MWAGEGVERRANSAFENRIAQQRFAAQGITGTRFEKPEDVVRWMGAVQAQDYLGALWGIGLRLTRGTQEGVERAIAERRIIRTWPMRGTLHFVPADDARWMTSLLAPRVLSRNAGRLKRDYGIDPGVLARSRKILSRALGGGKRLTREGIYKALGAGGGSANSGVGLHIAWWLAQEGLLCLGPREGKQQTFVLLDEWIPASHFVGREEGLARLALRYFTSHGPATARDFAWWAGLPLGEATRCVASLKNRLTNEVFEGQEYWSGPSTDSEFHNAVHLLPAFDEFTVGYTDRTAIVHPSYRQRGVIGFGIMSPVVVAGARVIGPWRRKIGKDRVMINVGKDTLLKKNELTTLKVVAVKYGRFLKRSVTVNALSRKGTRDGAR